MLQVLRIARACLPLPTRRHPSLAAQYRNHRSLRTGVRERKGFQGIYSSSIIAQVSEPQHSLCAETTIPSVRLGNTTICFFSHQFALKICGTAESCIVGSTTGEVRRRDDARKRLAVVCFILLRNYCVQHNLHRHLGLSESYASEPWHKGVTYLG